MKTDNRKRLVFIITKSEVGGAQKWVSEQKLLLEDKYDTFLITSCTGWLTDNFSPDKVFFVPALTNIKKISNLFSIAKILRMLKADIVVSNSANAGLYARLAKIIWKHRSIYVSHGWSCIYNGGRAKKILCFIERFLSFFSDAILCVSENDKDNALNIIGIKESKLKLIKNATFPTNKEKNFWHIMPKVLRLVFVGRMTHPKRPDLLAETLSRKKDVELFLVGGGEYLERLKNIYKNYDNIHFVGEIKDFNNYDDYDAFILVSESEGLPMSAIEAGVTGLPLLLSDVGGCHELIGEYEGKYNGVLFNNNINDISRAIDEVRNNYEQYCKVANKISCQFNLNSFKEDYIVLYEG
ncbi:glycosyltransferase [Escherichia coli]|nr:glycosyltransferase family 4 protein [Escherichia coli]EGQ5663939.1 glycosyltransferase family 4 protein [Escherichia coli]EGQ5732384.1 glycosyltransferase family 4 protein [Escherichia coli]EKC5347799.1 glycosyltransferase [Escherichia coli]EKC6047171.1 glycosyltransferase [Escherichia coli]